MREFGLSPEAVRRQLREFGVPQHKVEDAVQRLESAGPKLRKVVPKIPSKAASQKKLFRQWCVERHIPLPTLDYRFMAHLPKGEKRSYELDYAWPNVDGGGGYAIECHGGIWSRTRSGHQGKGHLRDMEKLGHSQRLGWLVDQVTPQELFSVKTMERIKSALGLP